MSSDIPVNLNGFRLRVVDDPAVKTYVDDNGVEQTAVDRSTGEPVYVISLHKKVAERNEQGRRPKGEEIKVTIVTEPVDIEDGDIVELVRPTAKPYHIPGGKYECSFGLSYKAVAASKVA